MIRDFEISESLFALLKSESLDVINTGKLPSILESKGCKVYVFSFGTKKAIEKSESLAYSFNKKYASLFLPGGKEVRLICPQ